jgi:hypothetical protein
MVHRGPKAAGLVPIVVKLLNTMRATLQSKTEAKAKTKPGWKLSDEIRNRLQRTIDDDLVQQQDDTRTHGLMLLFESVLRSTMGRKSLPPLLQDLAEDLKAPRSRRPPPGPHWLDDAATFDQAVLAINTVLAAIRPPAAIEAPADDLPFRGKFNALATLQDLVKAPAREPASASKHVRSMMHIRDTIGGDVVDRVLTFGKTAEQIRDSEPERLELAGLRRKHAASKLKPPGPPLSDSETRRMKALANRLATIPEGESMVFDDQAIAEFKRDPE